ncbi:Hypothetical_protein [Hexamita inflata]|uniref:Hypothetical_protein n=1 Tax=Hexamita inflata TaxID=28002 RepID=A0AA86QYP8_9EUKA|nr:Hypothetical protein HINF_LOCUS56179 [Hexamita inflata]
MSVELPKLKKEYAMISQIINEIKQLPLKPYQYIQVPDYIQSKKLSGFKQFQDLVQFLEDSLQEIQNNINKSQQDFDKANKCTLVEDANVPPVDRNLEVLQILCDLEDIYDLTKRDIPDEIRDFLVDKGLEPVFEFDFDGAATDFFSLVCLKQNEIERFQIIRQSLSDDLFQQLSDYLQENRSDEGMQLQQYLQIITSLQQATGSSSYNIEQLLQTYATQNGFESILAYAKYFTDFTKIQNQNYARVKIAYDQKMSTYKSIRDEKLKSQTQIETVKVQANVQIVENQVNDVLQEVKEFKELLHVLRENCEMRAAVKLMAMGKTVELK